VGLVELDEILVKLEIDGAALLEGGRGGVVLEGGGGGGVVLEGGGGGGVVLERGGGGAVLGGGGGGAVLEGGAGVVAPVLLGAATEVVAAAELAPELLDVCIAYTPRFELSAFCSG
jgi:hypothetical protein